MARNVVPLNDKQIKSARPKDKEYNLSDGKGLSLRIKPNGTKLWLYNYYHPQTKKRLNISLGQYPIVTLADARQIRLSHQGLLAKNIDPQSERDQQQFDSELSANNTFELIAGQWFELHKLKVNSTTAAKIWRSLEKDAFPRLGKIPIEEVTAPKAILALKDVIDRNSLEVARKVARRLNSIMVFAVNSGFIKHNALTGIRELIPVKQVTNMATLLPSELPELMQTLANANIKITTRCLIEWQLHTMTRPVETAQAKWSEIDLMNNMWVIPAERMKMSRPHQIPLTKQSMAVLEVMNKISANREYVFPADREPRNPANTQTANMALKRMGFKGRLVAHGMRALASTTLNEQDFDADIIEAALAHGDPDKIRSAYNRSLYLQQRIEMMKWWSSHIEKASIGKMLVGSLLGIKETVCG
jgi:integrase